MTPPSRIDQAIEEIVSGYYELTPDKLRAILTKLVEAERARVESAWPEPPDSALDARARRFLGLDDIWLEDPRDLVGQLLTRLEIVRAERDSWQQTADEWKTEALAFRDAALGKNVALHIGPRQHRP